jgi:putative hemin transport protein
MNTSAQLSLKGRWKQFRKEEPKLRIRDAAKRLGTSEAAILACFAGSSVMRLEPDFQGIMNHIPTLGYVMALTRNEDCVHERKGVFQNITAGNGPVGLVTGPDIDLRMFFEKWAFAFAVLEDAELGFKNSIQIFDRQGVAVIKIFLQETSNLAAFEKLVREFSLTVQDPYLEYYAVPLATSYNDGQIDEVSFRREWSELTDTHDFYSLLKKHNISRLHAMRIGGEFAQPIKVSSVKAMLELASIENWEIMVFVSNHGTIQIHTGPVNRIATTPGWVNVLDPAFNLHLRLDSIAECWLVKKPTHDGFVHSIEVFNKKGEMIVQFFGKRKPGTPESEIWRQGTIRIAAEFAL